MTASAYGDDMNPAHIDMTVFRNADFEADIALVDHDGAPHTLVGWTFVMGVSSRPGREVEDLVLSPGNGGIAATDPANGTFTVKIARRTLPAGAFHYDIVGLFDAAPTMVQFGRLIVEEGVGQP